MANKNQQTTQSRLLRLAYRAGRTAGLPEACLLGRAASALTSFFLKAPMLGIVAYRSARLEYRVVAGDKCAQGERRGTEKSWEKGAVAAAWSHTRGYKCWRGVLHAWQWRVAAKKCSCVGNRPKGWKGSGGVSGAWQNG